MKSPAFQFYAGDFLSSTAIALMDVCHVGGYMFLLAHDWNSDGIPDDDEQLAKLSRLGEGWLKGASSTVKRCFIPHPTKPGFITNARLMKERAKQEEHRQRSSEGGIKSARLRQLARGKGRSRVLAKPLVPKSNSSSSSSSTTKVVEQSAEEWMKTIRSNPAYEGINIDREMAKAETWCKTNRRVVTRKFFVNWLNRATNDAPIARPAVDKKPSEAERRLHGLNREELMKWARATYPRLNPVIGPEQLASHVVEEFRKTLE